MEKRIKIAQKVVTMMKNIDEVKAYINKKVIICSACSQENIINDFNEDKKYFCVVCKAELVTQ